MTEAWRQETGVVDGLEVTTRTASDPDAPDAIPGVTTELPFADVDAPEPAEDPLDIDAFPSVEEGTGRRPSAPAGDLVFLPVDGPDASSPSAATETDLSDVAAYSRDRSRLLFELGDRAGGILALEEAVRQYEGTNRFDEAVQAVDDLIRIEPDAIFRYQKRVELAYRLGDRSAMLQSYLGLADALLRSGGMEHAVTVYRRVLEHDPANTQAQAALAMLAPAPPPPPPAANFIDLGSLILDEPQVRDTRIRVDQQAPIENEDEAFHEALSQFKRGIDENIDAEDFQAHYDLGIAFKEMGLLDEAIAQFQKALRAPEGRLKTSEQLGIAFFDKARFAIAEAVLRRAIESLPGGDEDKIGLIYWLARALEAQRRFEESLKFYERVLAVDIRFLDVGDRVHRLTSGAS